MAVELATVAMDTNSGLSVLQRLMDLAKCGCLEDRSLLGCGEGEIDNSHQKEPPRGVLNV